MHPWCTWVLQEKEAPGLAQSVERLTAERGVACLIPGTGPIDSLGQTIRKLRGGWGGGGGGPNLRGGSKQVQ